MALHLITGYAGEEHITSADQGAYNMGTFGEGEFVLDRGSKFAATVVTNNQITIANGEALMQGRFIKLAVGTTESVTIDNGSSGMKRKDLIVLRYSKDAGTGIESVALAVKKGTPSSGTPSDPAVTTGTITDGTDLVNEMKLYRVNLDGLNIVSVDTLFSLKTTMVEYMDEYQLPVADADTLGGVKIGTNITRASDGKISIPDGSTSTKGILKVGSGLSVSDGAVSLNLPTASETTKGGIKVPSNKSLYVADSALQFRTYEDRSNISIYAQSSTVSIGGREIRYEITNSSLINRLRNGWIKALYFDFMSSAPVTWTIESAWYANGEYTIMVKFLNTGTTSYSLPDATLYYGYIGV